MRTSEWLNYEVSEEEWRMHWKEHIDIIKQLQEQGMKINLIIFNTDFMFKGEKVYG